MSKIIFERIEKPFVAGGNRKSSYYQAITEGLICKETDFNDYCDMCVFEFIADSGEEYTFNEPWREGVFQVIRAGLAGSGNIDAVQQATEPLRNNYKTLSIMRRMEYRRDKSHLLYKYKLKF